MSDAASLTPGETARRIRNAEWERRLMDWEARLTEREAELSELHQQIAILEGRIADFVRLRAAAIASRETA
jgi:uncharacterized coiled-coil protein SlyX